MIDLSSALHVWLFRRCLRIFTVRRYHAMLIDVIISHINQLLFLLSCYN